MKIFWGRQLNSLTYRKNLLQIDNGYINKGANASNAYKAIAQGGPLTQEGRKAIERDINKLTKERANLTGDELVRQDRLIAQRKTLLDLDEKRVAAKKQEATVYQKASMVIEGTNFEAKQREIISRRAGATAERLGALSSVGSNVELGGFTYGLQELQKAIDTSLDMNRWDKIRTKITGTFYAAAAAATVFANAFGVVAQIIGAVIGTFALLDAAFSNNAKEAEALNEQFDRLNSTIDTAERVTKKYGQTLTAASLIARATSFKELSDQLEELGTKFEENIKKMNNWAQMKEGVKDITNALTFGFFGSVGARANFVEDSSKALAEGLKKLPVGPAKKELEDKYKKILNSTTLQDKDFKKFLDQVSVESLPKIVADLQNLGKDAGDSLGAAAERVRGLKDALTAADTAATNFQNSLMDKSPINVYADSMITLGRTMQGTFRDGSEALIGLNSILNNSKSLQFMDPKSLETLKQAQGQLKDLVPALQLRRERLDTLLTADRLSQSPFSGAPITQEQVRRTQNITAARAEVTTTEQTINRILVQAQKVAADTVQAGYNIIDKQQKLVVDQAGVAASRKLYSGISGPGISQAMSNLNIQDFKIQKERLDIEKLLLDQQILQNINSAANTAAVENNTLVAKAQAEGRNLTEAEKTIYADRAKLIGGYGQVAKAVQSGARMSADDMAGLPEAAGKAYQAYIMGAGNLATKKKVLDIGILSEEKEKRLANLRDIDQAQLKILDTNIKNAETQVKINELQYASTEYLSDQSIQAEQLAKTTLINLQQERERKTIEYEIDDLNRRQKEGAKGIEPAIAAKEEELKNVKAQQTNANDATKIVNANEIITAQYARQNRELDFTIKKQDFVNQQLAQRFTSAKDFYSTLDKLGVNEGEILANLQNELRIQEELNQKITAEQSAQNEYRKEALRLDQEMALRPKDTAALQLEKDRAAAIRDQKIALAGQAYQYTILYKDINNQLTVNQNLLKTEQRRIQHLQTMLNLQQELTQLQTRGQEYLSEEQLRAQQAQEKQLQDAVINSKLRKAGADEAMAATMLPIANLQLKNITKELSQIAPENITQQQSDVYTAAVNQVKAAEEGLKIAQEIKKNTEDETTLEDRLFEVKQKIARLDNESRKTSFFRENQIRLSNIALDSEEESLKFKKDSFELDVKRGRLTEDEIIQFNKRQSLDEAELSYRRTRKTIIDETNRALQDAENLEKGAAIARGEKFDPTNPEFRAKIKAIGEERDARLDLADKTKASTDTIINKTGELSARQVAYENIFKSSFERMGDALANFVETGKWNFKSLINSLLSDLLRWEMRKAMSDLYSGGTGAGGEGGLRSLAITGGKAAFSWLGSLFSPSVGGPAPLGPGSGGSLGMPIMGGAALGAAFDQGYPIHKFAMGGSFTNSIVSSPTMFKFAQGTGLMGEAGPEAIMPLRRGSNGSLGVQAQPSNVQVIVNNSTGQPAQTRESMDSRGNRTIEVMVGDMVAQQMATKNSSVQQTMAGVFGTRPSVSRR
jgi:hypothetical protein